MDGMSRVFSLFLAVNENSAEIRRIRGSLTAETAAATRERAKPSELLRWPHSAVVAQPSPDRCLRFIVRPCRAVVQSRHSYLAVTCLALFFRHTAVLQCYNTAVILGYTVDTFRHGRVGKSCADTSV